MKYQKSLPLFLLYFFLGILPAASQTIWPTKNWASASPKDLGLNPDTLALLDASFANGSNGYMDGLLIIRHGKIAWQRTYRHDYAQIYKDQVNHKSGLNANDPSGPYNYFNDWSVAWTIFVYELINCRVEHQRQWSIDTTKFDSWQDLAKIQNRYNSNLTLPTN